MQATRSAFTASVMLGVLWGVWHLPRDLVLGQLSFWSLPGIVAFAILLTWVYNNTGGSLLLALLFHASIAVTGLFLSGVEAPLLDLALQWGFVAVVGAAAPPLSETSRLKRGTVPRRTGAKVVNFYFERR